MFSMAMEKQNFTFIHGSFVVVNNAYCRLLSSTDALGPKLEQHTKITWKTQQNMIFMPRWEGWHGVGITFSPNIQVILTRPATYKKSAN